MNVLVTGAAGFIGSHCCEHLLAHGHKVVGLDNFDPFYARSLKEANIAQAMSQPNYVLVESDLADDGAAAEAFRLHGPFDVVLHLAAKAGVRPSIEDPIGYERANMIATVRLLEQVVRQPRRPKFVFASSSSVYGNNPKTPFSESDAVDNPISPYAATKKSGELICHTYYHLYDLDVFCLRFFTVFGPRQRPDLAINKFSRRILAGLPIQMFGDGSTSRDYTYIDDIVLGVMRSIERCKGYEIINLGSDRPVKLSEMIDAVASACEKDAILERLPMQPGDVEITFADTAKARRLLDYQPTMDFRQGVRKFVHWLKAQEGMEGSE